MIDIKEEAAIFLAELCGCQALPEKCPDCHAPLVMATAQQMPFCIVCTAKRVRAQRDRDILAKAKLAAHGIVIEESRPIPQSPATRDEDDEAPNWPDGMPL